MNFNTITEFEQKIANFFGSPYAIAVDSCTHGLEICLRYTKSKHINVPKRTYISISFLAEKLYLKYKKILQLW
jgi:dTDP-4-amino-4,6-dideoxygalactose transaminase